MPRLRQVPRASASPKALEFYDMLFGDRDPVETPGTDTGTPGNWWTTFALAPALFENITNYFDILGVLSGKSQSCLSPSIRELGIMRAGYTIGSVFVLSQHSKVARANGIAEQKIADIGSWSSSSAFTDKERIVLCYADALLLQRGHVSDELFKRIQSVMSDEEILEFSYHTLSYAIHATISRALKLEYDDIEDRLKEIPSPASA